MPGVFIKVPGEGKEAIVSIPQPKKPWWWRERIVLWMFLWSALSLGQLHRDDLLKRYSNAHYGEFSCLTAHPCVLVSNWCNWLTVASSSPHPTQQRSGSPSPNPLPLSALLWAATKEEVWSQVWSHFWLLCFAFHFLTFCWDLHGSSWSTFAFLMLISSTSVSIVPSLRQAATLEFSEF